VSEFRWHDRKASDNATKHHVTFDEARTVELDPYRLIRPDPRFDLEDDRWIMIGYSDQGRLLVVVTSERGEEPRIISARRATKRERHAYETRP
jgi:uncharacterized DUF497 family protein